ncbi:SDR family oxidoreductase [Marivirga sp. S37H4]|uniref:SDR family oxidoreductase n=1 Tax=Marivirga aurantiaca TaxID=2802615 RepID=A0A935C6R5_9BACT|nr:SDR family oxidoreductase [Marivirga aurantiaca]MBK6264520.1 SDR family oxidoreductase [Marivirga aurantiaca]
MSKSLLNQIIVVTGGKGLLGRAIVTDIQNKGGIAINVDINAEDNIGKNELNYDLTQLDGIKSTIAKTLERYGRIDGWVNNAYPRTSDWGIDFLELTEESLNKNVEWQMNSYILCCQQIIKIFLKQKSGSIVNMASIYGVVGNDFSIYENTNINPPAAYSAIKGGLINFSRYLASKFGKDGIRINVVSPGGIFDHQDKKFVEAYEKKVPMKRMGNPDDIAPSVSFLLSDEAKYITGQNLVVDGGWTAI